MSAATGHFDISQLPSLRDGMTIAEESMKRRKTCRFIEEAGRVLKLPRVAVSTAEVFFHRFYAKHSFQSHDRFEVAVACILLAAKTEEAPKKLNVVMEECHKLKIRGMQAGRISSAPGSSPIDIPSELDPKSEEFAQLKERILLLERVILHTIGFELSIDHPYKFLVEQIKLLCHKKRIEYIDPAKSQGNTSQVMQKMMHEMVQYAMNFANDSMQTSLCLQFDPQRIAVAVVYLAGRFCGVQPTEGKSWMEILGDPDVESLVSIASQIIELVTDRKAGSPELYKKIQDDLAQLQEAKQEAKRQKTS